MASSARRSRDDDEDNDDDEEDDRPRQRRRRLREDRLPAGTPRVYVHKKCRGQTEMPVEEIESYLDNPFELGEDPGTYCSECEDTVPWKKCQWVETKQNLYDYLDDLRAEMVLSGNDPRPASPPLAWGLLGLSVACGIGLGAGIASGAGASRVVFGAAGAGLGLIVGIVWMFIERVRNGRSQEEWNRKLINRYYERHPEARSKKKKRARNDD